MKGFRLVFALLLVGAVGATVVWRDLADAQAQTIKIGVLFDQSGPFAAGGSVPSEMAFMNSGGEMRLSPKAWLR